MSKANISGQILEELEINSIMACNLRMNCCRYSIAQNPWMQNENF